MQTETKPADKLDVDGQGQKNGKKQKERWQG